MSTMIPTKKLVNSAETCVDESIEGYVTLNPGARQMAGHPRVIVRADIDDFKRLGKVVTVTGGGSGHEPCFMGTNCTAISTVIFIIIMIGPMRKRYRHHVFDLMLFRLKKLNKRNCNDISLVLNLISRQKTC